MIRNVSCVRLILFRFIDLKWLYFIYELYQCQNRNVEIYLL
jgi:hypothetical protein